MSKPIATNKKARRFYNLLDKFECGIVLQGSEVKSLRAGTVNFKDSFARVDNDQVFLYNLYIAPYAQASYMNPDSDRPRKLLLHKKEIKKLLGSTSEKRTTLVPTKIYFNARGLAKVEIALAQGKQLYDRREDIKKRDTDREIGRAMRNRNR